MFAPADHCLTRPSRTLFYFIFSCIYIRQGRTPFYRHTFRTVPVSSLPLPSDFPTAKVGCRACSGGLKCIPCKFFLSAKE